MKALPLHTNILWLISIWLTIALTNTASAEIDSFEKSPSITADTLIGEWEAIDMPSTVYYMHVHSKDKAVLVIVAVGTEEPRVYTLQNLEIIDGRIELSFTGISSISFTGNGVANKDPAAQTGLLEVEALQVVKSGHRDVRPLIFRKAHLAEDIYLAMKTAKAAAAN